MKKATKPSFIYHEASAFSKRGLKVCLHALMLLVFLFWSTLLHAQTPQILKDINGVTNNSQTAAGYNFKGNNGFVYFSAQDGFNGYELWKTNGTQAGNTGEGN